MAWPLSWQVLALPGFVWKQLSGEEVSWSKDFSAVDSVLVSGCQGVVPHGGSWVEGATSVGPTVSQLPLPLVGAR